MGFRQLNAMLSIKIIIDLEKFSGHLILFV